MTASCKVPFILLLCHSYDVAFGTKTLVQAARLRKSWKDGLGDTLFKEHLELLTSRWSEFSHMASFSLGDLRKEGSILGAQVPQLNVSGFIIVEEYQYWGI